MAESSESSNNNSWESWLGGWVQTAKEKSTTALEMVKKDLAEFTCTIQRDTERAVEMTKESLNKETTAHATNRVKAGLTSFLDNISRALVIPPDDDYVPVKVAPDGSGLYDRGKARLHAIQLDASTYMDPPEGPPEQYSMWQKSFDMDEHKGEISELLVSKVEVRALYTRLVPSEVSHAEFWQRYFYRVHQLDCDEARKQALMKRADQARGDSFTWDDDDDWSGNEEDNHSDWEKLPRPTQLTAAGTSQASDSNENTSVTPSVETDHQKAGPGSSDSDATLPCVVSSETDMKEQAQKTAVEQSVESVMSAVAASSAQFQDEELNADKTVPRGFILKTSPHDQDASTELLSHQDHLMPSADLWNLHTPSDIASASHTQQDAETGVTEPGLSLNVHRQGVESRDMSRESDSCAAGGDEDLSFANDDKPGIVPADAACGTVDPDGGCSQPHPAADLSSDISAASVEIAAEPYLAQVEAVSSCPSVSPVDEVAESESPSKVASSSSSEAKNRPVLGPASATPVAAATEVVPAVESAVFNNDNTKESSVSDTPNLSEKISDDLLKENETISKNTESSVEKESVLLSRTADGSEVKEIGMRLKGDMVVIGDRDSPLSSESNGTKEMGLEDWEQDFDIEVTEDDLKTAENIVKQLGENLNVTDDDWENWE